MKNLIFLFIATGFLFISCTKEALHEEEGINNSYQKRLIYDDNSFALNEIIVTGQLFDLNENAAAALLVQLEEVNTDGRFTLSNSCSSYIEFEFNYLEDVSIEYHETSNTYDIGLELTYSYDTEMPNLPCTDPICDYWNSTISIIGQGKRNFPLFANKCMLGSFDLNFATWEQTMNVNIDLTPILNQFDCNPVYCGEIHVDYDNM